MYKGNKTKWSKKEEANDNKQSKLEKKAGEDL